MKVSTCLSAALLSAAAAKALDTVSAVGNKFFTSNGTQFFIKGVAYQLTEDDPLVDAEQCARDAALMKTLGTNAIRVYHVDPKSDHDKCMSVFDAAGIYTLIDLDTFDTYILPKTPYWNETQFARYAEVMDTFHKYNNVLGFFVGNEIIAQADHSLAAPYIKASARDLKAYRDAKGYRPIPIGYSAADIAELRPMLQDYLTCGGNSSEIVDFFGLNSYQWCDPSAYEQSGYINLQKQAKDFPVPIFFSETGCNQPGPRIFDDQVAVFGDKMVNDWSGSIIYEWIEEANEYGLISYGPKPDATATGADIKGGFSRAGTPTPVSPDFENLKAQWAKATPTGVASANYKADSVSTRACPASTEGGWLVDGNVALPTFGGGPVRPSATGSASGTAASPSSTNNPAPANREIAGMSAGLVGVMLFFTFWL
ncbi:Glucanosyltransferase-domain-containing protein [Lasiosphaeris hirsuta]|uniref:1,3-beta-glucanosyltransferase n=1 Tax=Lasiosphaeris hirsuta TaxID=260670 RepID=A0AA40DKL0_9PEZI|nr:Glucanosyltransferase-domain-containing protein [Lasiosphaeris hirsuta]